MNRIRTATIVAIVLMSSTAGAEPPPRPTRGPLIRIQRGRQAGTATISVMGNREYGVVMKGHQAWLPSSMQERFKVTVPVAVANQLVKAAKSGPVRFNAVNDWGMARIQIRAGKGASAVAIRRSRMGGGNTSLQVQLKGRSYWVSQTEAMHTGRPGVVTGRSGIFRTGASKVIDPRTLEPKPAAGKPGERYSGSLQWLMKPAPRTKLRSYFPANESLPAVLDVQL